MKISTSTSFVVATLALSSSSLAVPVTDGTPGSPTPELQSSPNAARADEMVQSIGRHAAIRSGSGTRRSLPRRGLSRRMSALTQPVATAISGIPGMAGLSDALSGLGIGLGLSSRAAPQPPTVVPALPVAPPALPIAVPGPVAPPALPADVPAPPATAAPVTGALPTDKLPLGALPTDKLPLGAVPTDKLPAPVQPILHAAPLGRRRQANPTPAPAGAPNPMNVPGKIINVLGPAGEIIPVEIPAGLPNPAGVAGQVVDVLGPAGKLIPVQLPPGIAGAMPAAVKPLTGGLFGRDVPAPPAGAPAPPGGASPPTPSGAPASAHSPPAGTPTPPSTPAPSAAAPAPPADAPKPVGMPRAVVDVIGADGSLIPFQLPAPVAAAEGQIVQIIGQNGLPVPFELPLGSLPLGLGASKDGVVTGALGQVSGALPVPIPGPAGTALGMAGSTVDGVTGGIPGGLPGPVAGAAGTALGMAGSLPGNLPGPLAGAAGTVMGVPGTIAGLSGSLPIPIPGAVGSMAGNVGTIPGTLAPPNTPLIGGLGALTAGLQSGEPLVDASDCSDGAAPGENCSASPSGTSVAAAETETASASASADTSAAGTASTSAPMGTVVPSVAKERQLNFMGDVAANLPLPAGFPAPTAPTPGDVLPLFPSAAVGISK